MDRRIGPLVIAVSLAALLAAGVVLGGTIDPSTRTVKAGALEVRWSLKNPEEIVSVRFKGGPNLTRSAPIATGCRDDLEFFGDAWGTAGDENFVSPVGWGTTGTWASNGGDRVRVSSRASGCYGTSDIPVATTYRFSDTASAFTVQRQFTFASTPFVHDLRAFIPRLHPLEKFTQVLHPTASRNTLVTESSAACEDGCHVANWNGTWFAVHAPSTGQGMIVVHRSGPRHTLWVDQDGGASATTSSSVLLVEPAGGFTGTVTDIQTFCFYDSSTWKPSLTLPKGCTSSSVSSRPAQPKQGVLSRAWMSLPGRAAAVTHVTRTKGLQANYTFKVVPVAGSRVRVTWYRDRHEIQPIEKGPAPRVTSVLLTGSYIESGLYEATLSVRPPAGSFRVLATARVRVG